MYAAFISTITIFFAALCSMAHATEAFNNVQDFVGHWKRTSGQGMYGADISPHSGIPDLKIQTWGTCGGVPCKMAEETDMNGNGSRVKATLLGKTKKYKTIFVRRRLTLDKVSIDEIKFQIRKRLRRCK